MQLQYGQEPHWDDNELYNISADDGNNIWRTGREIRTAAKEWNHPLLLDVGKRHPLVWCWLAATVHGWCTVVLEHGSILREWAGCFYSGTMESLETLYKERNPAIAGH